MSGPYECCYASGWCSHEECGAYPFSPGHQEPQPTEADYCASGGHGYYGDEFNPDDAPEAERAEVQAVAGRCYCGERRYPFGGPGGNQQ